MPLKTSQLGGKLQKCSQYANHFCECLLLEKTKLCLRLIGDLSPGGKLSSGVKGKARQFIASANCSGYCLGSGCRKYD